MSMANKTDVIMPALGMVQETGKIIQWLKAEGQPVVKGEPLMEVETDKAAVEIEAPASGILAQVTAQEGQDVPVGTVIAVILAPDETGAAPFSTQPLPPQAAAKRTLVTASPLAARMAMENQIDLSMIKPEGGRVEKSDVLAYLQANATAQSASVQLKSRPLASPKARRLAAERGLDLARLQGSGPEGAVLAADVLDAAAQPVPAQMDQAVPLVAKDVAAPATEEALTLSTAWRLMAERTTASWTGAPHFYLLREVNASRLVAWREQAQKQSVEKITYTDLLIRLVVVALRKHPRLNVAYRDGRLFLLPEINIGLAVAVEEGLVVPVIHQADQLSVTQIAAARAKLVERARAGKLRPDDITGGTFTLSNLGMYGVDAFNAVLNPPQAAILAVGRIADRVVPVNGMPAVAPVMMLSASFDHRAVDGARGAQFLGYLAELIEEPLALLS
jgi:pyruvate dehydrogenase E2 component (dihydrolipoamide acetyltransferase)